MDILFANLFTLSEPDAPWGLTASNYDQTQVTLKWKQPLVTTREGLKYTVRIFLAFSFLVLIEITQAISFTVPSLV